MTATDTPSRVDAYFEDRLLEDDPVLRDALTRSADAGLPPIAVSPALGAFLNGLAKAIRAARILEVGTLGGYSTIWLARAVPAAGRVVTLEIAEAHAAVARRNIEAAGLSERVEIRLGSGVDTLDELIAAGTPAFDMVFIDADKPSNAAYFERAVRLSRPGTVIIVDNVVRNGAVADAESRDPNVQGVRTLIDALEGRTDVTATALQTVGIKGYDGFLMAVVT